MKKLILFFVLLTSIFVNVQNSWGQTNLPCLTMASQVEVDRCIAFQYMKIYHEMDTVYHHLVRQLEDTLYQDALRTAQDAWRVFVTNHCECEAHVHRDGSMANLMRYKCLMTATESRIESLELLLQNNELER